MPYRIKLDESVLRQTGVHAARKRLKKIRGVLCLVRPELAEWYRVENVRYRDVGRDLSQIRDAQVMI